MNSHVPRERGSVWQADVASIIILVVFVVIVYGIEQFIQPSFTASGLLITGIILAIVPAIIWLAFFYRRDRLEPEPKHMVFRLFLLGGLLAAAIGVPLVDNVFEVPGSFCS